MFPDGSEPMSFCGIEFMPDLMEIRHLPEDRTIVKVKDASGHYIVSMPMDDFKKLLND